MTAPGSPKVRRFLEKSRTVRIATISPAGNPDIIPLWFVSRGGRIYMATRSENPVVRDLKQNPEVVLTFHGERGARQDKVLRMRGHAIFRTDRGICSQIYALSTARYFLTPGGMRNTVQNLGKFRVRLRYYGERSGEGGVIEVEPRTAEFLPNPQPAKS